MIIPLTQGYEAIVDNADYLWLNRWIWYARMDRGKHPYALRNRRVTDGNGPATIYMHREILSVPSELEIDHINRDTLDNRRNNLRICTGAENRMNTGLRSTNKSGYMGVNWHTTNKKWTAAIRVRGKLKSLGSYDDIVEAANAYDKAATEYHGEFASLNFPQAAND